MTHIPDALSIGVTRPRRPRRLHFWWLAICCLAAALPTRAQVMPDDASRLERIVVERRQADAVLEQQLWVCSRRFVVTACMNEARAAHREVVELLGREEEAIDSRARQARAAKRLEIIRQKTEAFARLSPVPTAQPAASPQPDAGQPPAAAAESAPVSSASQKDPAAADRAAARRAAASRLRREEAAREQAQRAAKRAEQRQPLPGLPARPPIPPVNPASSAN